MREYQAVRISVEGRPTYGDVYRTVYSTMELKYGEIYTIIHNCHTERVSILFEAE